MQKPYPFMCPFYLRVLCLSHDIDVWKSAWATQPERRCMSVCTTQCPRENKGSGYARPSCSYVLLINCSDQVSSVMSNALASLMRSSGRSPSSDCSWFTSSEWSAIGSYRAFLLRLNCFFFDCRTEFNWQNPPLTPPSGPFGEASAASLAGHAGHCTSQQGRLPLAVALARTHSQSQQTPPTVATAC